MKFSVIVLTNIIFATITLAVPGSLAHRRTIHAWNTTDISDGTEMSINWAGAILSPPGGDSFNGISTAFNAPTLQAPIAGDGSWSASIGIGIDGTSYTGGYVMTGMIVTLTSTGGEISTSFIPWYQWATGPSTMIDGVTISAGDAIMVSFTTSNLAEGVVTIENHTTGLSVTQSVSAPSILNYLAGESAEWIVQDFVDGGPPFVNFGTVDFANCTATTAGGKGLDLSGAQLTDIELSSGGPVLTNSAISGAQALTVKYITNT